MTSITLTWHIKDQDACPICKALDGQQWTFTVGKDTFPDMLTFNGQNVWDIHQGSRAHGHEQFNCRCHITSAFNLSDLKGRIETLRNQLQKQADSDTP